MTASTSASGNEARHAATERRQRFLAESSRALAESLDYAQTLQTVARRAVPDVADCCTVDVLQLEEIRAAWVKMKPRRRR